MSMPQIEFVLLYGFLLNMGLLFIWFIFLALAHDWVYRMHQRFYRIPVETFDAIHYAGIMAFKMAIFAFFLVPYLALRIAG